MDDLNSIPLLECFSEILETSNQDWFQVKTNLRTSQLRVLEASWKP